MLDVAWLIGSISTHKYLSVYETDRDSMSVAQNKVEEILIDKDYGFLPLEQDYQHKQ